MTQARELPLWRSLLFVPANVDRFVDRAHERGADAVILDLEDSIVPEQKAAARACVPAAAAKVRRNGAHVVVRINRPWRQAIADLEAAVCREVDAIALPKVPNAGHIGAIAEVLDCLEEERGLAPGHTRLIAFVETAAAVFELASIARADARLVGLTLGSEDFALDMGIVPEPDALVHAAALTVMAARAAGILPLGGVGSLAGFGDLSAYREGVRRAHRLGFAGGMCIHPSQVPILNAEHAPSRAEVAEARRILDCYESARSNGQGAVRLDGRMLDEPIAERARRLLQRHEAAGRWPERG